MKKYIIFLSIICIAFSATAQNALATSSIDPEADAVAIAKMRHKMDSIRQYRPTVAVVLAGGGAKGAAHIGALEYIEELGIPVDMVLGTSMGGLMGGLYAMGYPAKTIDSILVSTNWNVMMSDNVPSNSLSYQRRKYNETFAIRPPFFYEDEEWQKRQLDEYNARVINETENPYSSADMGEESLKQGFVANLPDGYLYGYNVYNIINSLSAGYQDSMDFADLPKPYCCVAADLVTMKAKYWTSGRLTEAMRSTMSIPMYFTPIRSDGMVLVDGGIRNNFPTDMARAMGADYVIGVDLSQPRTYKEINGMATLLLQIIALTSKEAFDNNIPLADVYIHPDMTGMNMLSFNSKSISDILQRGRDAARSQDAKLSKIAKATANKAVPVKTKKRPAVNLNNNKVVINKIKFEGIDSTLADFLQRNSNLNLDEPFGREEIEKELMHFYGSGLFDQLTYSLAGNQEPFELVIHGKRGPIHQFGMGLRIDSKSIASLALSLGLNRRKPTGFKSDFTAIVGNNLKGDIDLYYITKKGIAFGIDIKSLHLKTAIYSAHFDTLTDYSCNTKFWQNSVEIYVGDNRWLSNGAFKAGLHYEVLPFEQTTILSNYLFSNRSVPNFFNYLSDDAEKVMGMEYSYKGEWSNHLLEAFVEGTYDNTDDGYFPTKGFLVSARYDCIFESQDENGESNQYQQLRLNAKGVIPVSKRFAIIPSLQGLMISNFNFSNFNGSLIEVHSIHESYIGGVMMGEYGTNHLSYIGFNCPHELLTCNEIGVFNLDFRYQLGRKDYLTFTAACYKIFNQPQGDDTYRLGFGDGKPTDYTFALQYGHKSLIGPVTFNVHWSAHNRPTRWGCHLTIGFDF